MLEREIDTRLVYGFLDAGKTTYIRDCIQNDYFYKYGTTLILCFEEGETSIDSELLSARNAYLACYDGEESIGAFCYSNIEKYRPDRIYVEMNTMMPDLRDQFPSGMHITFAITWIAWDSLPVYYLNLKQMIKQMVSLSQQVIFRNCPSKELLEPYSQPFRLMNQTASYLRQDPMGYHEKAFDLFLPFSPEAEEITITAGDYLPLWLDAFDHPEHYTGKTIRFSEPLELRQSEETGRWSAGRVVMVCCMADLQYMAFELEGETGSLSGGWAVFDAIALIGSDEYGQKRLKLSPLRLRSAPPPDPLILNEKQPDDRPR